MTTLYIFLWILAIILFGIAAYTRQKTRLDFIALGLLVVSVIFLIQTISTVAG